MTEPVSETGRRNTAVRELEPINLGQGLLGVSRELGMVDPPEIPVVWTSSLRERVAVVRLVPSGSLEESSTPHQAVVIGDPEFVRTTVGQMEEFGRGRSKIEGSELASELTRGESLPEAMARQQGLILFLRETDQGVSSTVVKRGAAESPRVFTIQDRLYAESPFTGVHSEVGKAWLIGTENPVPAFCVLGSTGQQEALVVGPRREDIGESHVWDVGRLEKSLGDVSGARFPILARLAKRIKDDPPSAQDLKGEFDQAATAVGEDTVPFVIIGKVPVV